MAAVTQTIPNYLGGVSNQPDDKKHPGQVKEAINAYPDPTFGLTKRPGFKFLTELKDGVPTGGTSFDQTDLDNAKWFYYNRDPDEKYLGCIIGNATANNAGIHVWNAVLDSGSYKKCTVNYTGTVLSVTNDGTGAGTNGSLTGLATTSSGAGTGMKVNVTIDGNVASAITVHTEGSGYKIGDTVTIDKSLIPGTSSGKITDNVVGTITTHTSLDYLGKSSGDVTLSNGDVATESTAITAADYDFITIRDTSIIVNKQKYVLQQAVPTFNAGRRSTIRIHSIEYGTQYKISINPDGVSEFHSTLNTRSNDVFTDAADTTSDTTDDGTGKLDAAEILTALRTLIIAGGDGSPGAVTGFGADQVKIIGTSIEITSTVEFTVQVKGGVAGQALTSYQDTVGGITELAAITAHDRTVKIQNTSSIADTYYTKFVAEDGISGPGYWEETLGSGVSPGMQASTLPHELKNTAKNVFTFGPISWVDRIVGDSISNSHPTFVDNKIQQSFYYNNRLGFLTEDNVSMSKSGEFFDFYMTTAQGSTDADPIDISCSSTRPALLHGIIPTAGGLMLFSQNQQFIMFSSEGNLTPSTALIRGLSNYRMDTAIDPVDVGTHINFVSKTHETAGFTRVFGMLPQAAGTAPKVVDVGRVVAEYIPATITALTASPQNSFIAMYGNTLDKIYFYRTYNDGEKDIMQTWFNWNAPGNVHYVEVDSDTLYSVIKTGTSTAARYSLCSATLTQTPEEEIIVTAEGQQVNPHMDFYAATTAVNEYPVESITITNQGSGYSGTPTVTIAAPASGTQATGTAVVADNKVTGVTITNPGKGYNPIAPPAVTFSGGGGSSAAATATVYDGSYCQQPFTNISALKPVVIISGNASDNFAGTTESGLALTPSRATVNSVDYFTVPNKDLSDHVAKVFLGYAYSYDITLPKIYYYNDPEKKIADYTASLTVSRCKFSVGQSSVVGFKLKRKGVQADTESYTADGTTTAFSPIFTVKDKADVVVKRNGAKQNLVTTFSGDATEKKSEYQIADHATLSDRVTVTFGSAPATTTFWAHGSLGSGYSNDTDVATTGGSGTGLTVNTTTTAGAITSAVVSQAGTGYKTNELITVSGGGANAVLMIKTLPDTVEVYVDQWYVLNPTQNANYYLGDDVPIERQNTFTIPIHQKADNYTLRIFSDSPFPLALTSMAWEGQYSPRYYRRT